MYFQSRGGWIEVVCGPMFSGKSEELIRRLKRGIIARQRVQIFKAAIDDRYSDEDIVSHSSLKIQAQPVENTAQMREFLDDRSEIVGIDEAQFFDADVVLFAQRLANLGKRVIIAGLDLDYLGEPFDVTMRLMAVAEYVTKSLAVCTRCGAPASRTQRLVPVDDRIVVGSTNVYEPRCRMCFDPDLSHMMQLDMLNGSGSADLVKGKKGRRGHSTGIQTSKEPESAPERVEKNGSPG